MCCWGLLDALFYGLCRMECVGFQGETMMWDSSYTSHDQDSTLNKWENKTTFMRQKATRSNISRENDRYFCCF